MHRPSGVASSTPEARLGEAFLGTGRGVGGVGEGECRLELDEWSTGDRVQLVVDDLVFVDDELLLTRA